jgi:hypothetical protein
MKKKRKFDLHTFVAGDALESGDAFPVHCNCSGIITVFSPFEEEFVVCPKCESRIGIHILDGDPGYIFGANPATGEPILIPVQGSSEQKLNLSPKERERLLAEARKRFSEKKK